MTAFLRVVQVVALGLGTGSLVLFSFVVAPALFTALPRDMAGRATAAIFPRYYALGAACAGAALAAACAQAVLRGAVDRRLLAEILLAGSMLGAIAWAGGVLLPRAAAARAVLLDPARAAEHDAARAAFGRLHRRSVLLNGAALLTGLAALGAAALPWRDLAR